MARSADIPALKTALQPLRDAGVVPAIRERLREGIPLALQRLVRDTSGEVSAYSETANPDVIPELRQHFGAQLLAVCNLLGESGNRDLEFVREHAERRAAQRFPLDALLQSYRCLHRMLSQWIRDAALEIANEDAHVRRVVAAVTDFTIEYTGAVGSIATSSYVSQTRRLAEAEGDQRSALLNTLLDGYDESDQHAARLLRRSGYLQQRLSYCVAVARSVNPAEMENAARAQRMADSISDILDRKPVRHIVGVRDNHVVVVMSATRRISGWTAPQSRLADRVYPELRKVGPAALIGLSNDVPSTSHIPRALEEARLAIEYADVANRVVPFASMPFQKLLVSVARSDLRTAMPAWLESFVTADSRGRLAATLAAYADCDMNVQKASKALSVHPNTIYARIQKIDDITGLNALSYHALTEMLLALECHASGRQKESRA